VSGFIGSGGAFVMTPAMMTLGVPGGRRGRFEYLPQIPEGARRGAQAAQVRAGRLEARHRDGCVRRVRDDCGESI
jgi:hypothetical protein